MMFSLLLILFAFAVETGLRDFSPSMDFRRDFPRLPY